MTHNPTNDLQLDLLIEHDKIADRIKAVAKELDSLYEGKELTLVMIMKGSIFLVSDLMRHLHLPMRLEFLQCMSYGEQGMQKGDLQISGVDALDLKEKHVLVVDDIFDTGETLGSVLQKIQKKQPLLLRSLVLMCKDVPRQTDMRPDFSLFDIEDHFVVGYGLDYKEYYRGLPDIYAINP